MNFANFRRWHQSLNAREMSSSKTEMAPLHTASDPSVVSIAGHDKSEDLKLWTDKIAPELKRRRRKILNNGRSLGRFNLLSFAGFCFSFRSAYPAFCLFLFFVFFDWRQNEAIIAFLRWRSEIEKEELRRSYLKWTKFSCWWRFVVEISSSQDGPSSNPATS